MENVLYLDDYINLYNKDANKIIVIKPYQDSLKNGKVKDNLKFIKSFNKIITDYHLNKGIFNNKILIIINKDYTKLDKITLNNIMEELNYKNVLFKYEYEYLNLNMNSVYIIYNETYFYLYYLNEVGKVKYLIYGNNLINRNLIPRILKSINKKDIVIYGKKYAELNNILINNKFNYYYFEESANLILKFVMEKICQVENN